MLLDRQDSPYSQLLATTTLTKLISRTAQVLSLQQRIDIRKYCQGCSRVKKLEGRILIGLSSFTESWEQTKITLNLFGRVEGVSINHRGFSRRFYEVKHIYSEVSIISTVLL